MTSKERTILTTTRDCQGRLVPVGDPVTIPAATFVTLVQSLGQLYGDSSGQYDSRRWH